MRNPHVLVVDDEADIRALIKDILSDEGYGVAAAANANEARAARASHKFDLILLDIWMPDTDGITLLREWSEAGEMNCPVVIMSGHGTVDTAVEATRLGAFDFVEKPLSLAKLLRTVEAALESVIKTPPGASSMLPPLMTPIGRSKAMHALREKVQQYARHEQHVLISGEPGSGRGAFARYLHGLSRRADHPLISVTAASLTERNAEEQLCGREDDGNVMAGAFERAGKGTLVIDDLADLNDAAQKILLGALEDGTYRRVNGHSDIRLDARVIATVGANCDALVEKGKQIFMSGNAASGVAACSACHAPNGVGNPAANFPSLQGQHADYTVKQLKDFRAGNRINDAGKMMQGVAAKMTDDEIAAVASYIQGLN